MRKTTSICLSLLVLGLPSACGQIGYQGRSPSEPARGAAPASDPQQEPGPEKTGSRAGARQPGRPYAQTRARLQLFREEIEFDDLDVEVGNGADASLRDIERDRFGFRAEFGRQATAGFFQLFVEEMRAPALLLEDFDNIGLGGGAVGAPVVGDAGRVELLVPYRFEVDFVGGSESVGGFDQDLFYFEAVFELGFGARAFGAQASAGVVVDSLAGWFDSNNPASLANGDNATIMGTNVGAYAELVYKHDQVPLMARVRGIAGDVSGVMFSFGFAF